MAKHSRFQVMLFDFWDHHSQLFNIVGLLNLPVLQYPLHAVHRTIQQKQGKTITNKQKQQQQKTQKVKTKKVAPMIMAKINEIL